MQNLGATVVLMAVARGRGRREQGGGQVDESIGGQVSASLRQV